MNVLPVLSIVYSQHEYKHRNFTSTCKVPSVSRTIYYEWVRRFNQFGYLGLQDKEKSKSKSNGIVERFNRTLLEKFYQIVMIKKIYSSLAELQDDLDRFIYYYNFKRTNQGYRLIR
ncbi:MAG: transposase [Parcubacteria group bacterium]|nr:transposase [Parcubacteria group bacterium]